MSGGGAVGGGDGGGSSLVPCYGHVSARLCWKFHNKGARSRWVRVSSPLSSDLEGAMVCMCLCLCACLYVYVCTCVFACLLVCVSVF